MHQKPATFNSAMAQGDFQSPCRVRWTLGTAHWLRIPLLAQRLLWLLQGESQLVARTHGPTRASLAHKCNRQWKHLNLGAGAVMINSNLCAASSGNTLPLHTRSLTVPRLSCSLSRTRVTGMVLLCHSVARSSASSSDSARSPAPARLSVVPSARSAPVRLPPIAPLR